MKKKVLVVDDSNFFLKVMNDMLTGLGFEVTTTFDAEEACKFVAASKFDLICTDLNMPGMDGIEFVKRAKQIPNCKFVPIVMLSAENNQERIAEAKKQGISLFLTKPVEEERLKNILQVVFNSNSNSNNAKSTDRGEEILKNATFYKKNGKELFVLNFSTDSHKEIIKLIDETARQIRSRPPKSVRALTLVNRGMFTNEILDKLKELTRGNAPYIERSAVVGVTGAYKVAMSTISTFSRRQFKVCNTRNEALHYLLQD